MHLSTLFSTQAYQFLGGVKLFPYFTRQELIQLFIQSINLQNGEINIKVQDGTIVFMEIGVKIRNDDEGKEILSKIQF